MCSLSLWLPFLLYRLPAVPSAPAALNRLPCPEGETVTDDYGLSDSTFRWLDGQTFWHLFAAKDGLVLVDDIDPFDPAPGQPPGALSLQKPQKERSRLAPLFLI